MKTYNYYCDESCHLENDHHQYMILGLISVPYNQLKIHKEYIKQIKQNHNFYAEIKWTKVSESKKLFYKEILDYFFSSDLSFRAILWIKQRLKKNIMIALIHYYYKMYYQLIYHRLDMLNKYNIYLDIKDTLSVFKLNKLKEILQYKFGEKKHLR